MLALVMAGLTSSHCQPGEAFDGQLGGVGSPAAAPVGSLD
jgi:hypothetical protein